MAKLVLMVGMESVFFYFSISRYFPEYLGQSLAPSSDFFPQFSMSANFTLVGVRNTFGLPHLLGSEWCINTDENFQLQLDAVNIYIYIYIYI